MKVRPSSGSPAASLLIRGIPGSLRNKALVSRLYSDCGEFVTRRDVSFFLYPQSSSDNAWIVTYARVTSDDEIECRNGNGIRGIGAN